jgi:ABC-type amino acid transport substrate-binding protein
MVPPRLPSANRGSAPARAAAWLLAAVAWALPAAGCGGGGSADPAVLRVATEAAYPPFESTTASGEIVGFDIDLVRAVAREAGLTAEFTHQEFAALIPALEQGRFDAAVSAMTITEERAKVVAFTDPYYDAGQVVVVRSGAGDAIRGRDDLGGRTVAVQLNTTGQMEAAKLAGATVKPFESAELAFLELLAGRCDAVINDEPTSRVFTARHPGLRVAGGVFTQEKYGIAVRKDRPELVARLNTALVKVRASGEYDRLRAKWLDAPAAAAAPEAPAAPATPAVPPAPDAPPK